MGERIGADRADVGRDGAAGASPRVREPGSLDEDEHAERRDEGRHVALRDEEAVDEPDRSAEREGHGEPLEHPADAVAARLGHDDRAEPDDGPDGDVDPAHEKHERLTDRDEAEDRRLLRDVDEVVAAEERLHRAGADEEEDEHAELRREAAGKLERRLPPEVFEPRSHRGSTSCQTVGLEKVRSTPPPFQVVIRSGTTRTTTRGRSRVASKYGIPSGPR